jgi:hypothetical protein
LEVAPVTALGTRPGPRTTAGETAPPAAPVPRRVRAPRWLDLRLVLGVLLVLGSVLLGARVVTAADATVPVWSAAGDLAAGTVLSPEDLVPVEVRLDDAAGAYLSTSTRPQGRTLTRAVRRGELVPGSALDTTSTEVQLALPVQAGYVPPGLARGQRVDVYAISASGASTSSGGGTGAVAVVRDATVQAISGRAQGVLSSPTTTVQVVVSVAAERAPEVLTAIGGRPLAVVVHAGVDAAPGGPTG